MKIYNILFVVFFVFGCNSICIKENLSSKSSDLTLKKDANDLSKWWQKDLKLNSVPGISLKKWYDKNDKSTSIDTVIVAVIDTQLDISHEDLKDRIWVNRGEIPNNGLDDDRNGYVDDVNGWNFIGTKSGNYIVWGNFEFVRFIRKWEPYFTNNEKKQILIKDTANYNTFKWAQSMLDYKFRHYSYKQNSLKHNASIYQEVKDTLKYFFPKEDYTYEKLDSLYRKIKVSDRTYKEMRDSNAKDLPALVYYMMIFIASEKNNLEQILDEKTQIDSILNKNLNIDYNERVYIGDNDNILEKGYGNNKINAKIKGIRSFNGHNTLVSGVIAAKRDNKIGIEGFSNNIKIMPLVISPSGDEHDKDIAMAIRYAVDNGAKVINMSFAKEFSVHQEWVTEAMFYAEQHNVLLVHAAGNESNDIDTYPNYPNDFDYDTKKVVCDNFINVGSISHRPDSTLVSSFSNYGKQNVDLFAPGEEIYTTAPDNKYVFDSGTSLAAPMVSGTAALIWLYYPNLSAKEVKQIIMESGTAYDLEVLVPGKKGVKAPFSDLSKSGKVLNVYNAMKLAKKISKRKKNAPLSN